jgi:uncharacterized RDD family membrane protein YckC
MEQQSLLLNLDYNPVLASTGKRFLNYLIDLIVFIIPIALILVWIFIPKEYSYDNYYRQNTFSHQLSERVVALLVYSVLYFLSEIIMKGRTIGKFITGTKAVNIDGTEMEPKTILLRSLSRVVPFEPFSALSNPCRPWHDKWTRTQVIDVKQTALNNPAYQQL